MIPVIIAAAAGAVVGGVAVAALSDDDDKQPSSEQQTKRILSESQLPSAVKHKLEKKRHDNSDDDTAIDFVEIENMLSRPRRSNAGIKNALQQLEQQAVNQRDAFTMNKVAIYYGKIHEHNDADRCFELGKKFARG